MPPVLVHRAVVKMRSVQVEPRGVVQHGIEADAVELELDDEWAELSDIRIVFSGGTGGSSAVVPYSGEQVSVPRRLMEEAGPLYLTVVGTSSDGRRVVTRRMARPMQVVPSGDIDGSVLPDDPSGGGSSLPIATTDSLGCVIVGSQLTVTPTGRLSGVVPAPEDIGVELLDNKRIDEILV